MPRKLKEIEQDIEKYWSEKFSPGNTCIPQRHTTIFETYGTHNLHEILDKIKRKAIIDALKLNRGVVSATAEYLEYDYRTLQRDIERYNINPKSIKKNWYEKYEKPLSIRQRFTRENT